MRNENPYLQGALIVFVIITVALGASTYILFNQAEDATKAAAAAEEKATREKNRADAQQFAVVLLKRTIGWSTENEAQIEAARSALESRDLQLSDDIKKIEETFNADMKKFADETNYPPENRNYRVLPTYLLSVTQTKNDQLTAHDDRNKQLKDSLDTNETELEKAKTNFSDELAKKETAIAKLDNDYIADRKRMTGELDSRQKVIDDKNKAFDKLTKESSAKIQELEIDLNKTIQLKEAYASKVHKQETDTFESPDGRITWVNQGQKIVWINLGPADGLRHQMTFSVFDRGETNVQESNAKGKIEVIRLIDRHLSAARILDDSLENPLLPDDLIFSPSWHPGQRIHFALMNFMDFDGDGKNDRTQIRNMIELNGGVIDLEVMDDGTTKGPGMTIDTRYLVTGAKANEKTSPDMLRTITAIRGEADQLGVELLSYNKLLNQMGYTQEARVVGLGKNADSSQFGIQQRANASSTGDTSSLFRKRRAPSRTGSGGY